MDGAEEIGRVVRTRDRVRPLFVSPGHRVSMARAVQIVLACGRGYRLPEPTRQAHIESNKLRVRQV
jgi:deoxyribonuclease V